jgi:hypothetical protein
MRAIGIDSFLEALEESRTPGTLLGLPSPSAYDWGRIVAEGRAARAAADGGKWRIGQLALLVERKYRSRSLQRFAKDINECYATVRRYRWVVSRYDAGIRFRFPGLSFSHFQAAAALPDRVSWLSKAEKGLWSVDRLIRETRTASPASVPGVGVMLRVRPQMIAAARSLQRVKALDDTALLAADPWLEENVTAIARDAGEIASRLAAAKKRLVSSSGHRAARSRRPVKRTTRTRA